MKMINEWKQVKERLTDMFIYQLILILWSIITNNSENDVLGEMFGTVINLIKATIFPFKNMKKMLVFYFRKKKP